MTDPQSDQTLDQHSNVFHERLSSCEQRLTAVEERQDGTEDKLDNISRELLVIRTEGKTREVSTNSGFDRIGAQVSALEKGVAALTGAQAERNRLAEEGLRRLRKWAIIIGIFSSMGAAVGGTLLSDQEVASTIWVKWLHWREPWDASVPVTPQPQPQDSTYIIGPRGSEDL